MAGCPLFHNDQVLCRVKEGSQHKWVSTGRMWYIRNYCETSFHTDCEDFQAYIENQAIGMGKILVIDDEPILLETLNGFFGNRGYQVLTAASAEEALQLIEREHPVLALIDIKLPGMNGIELLKIIKKKYPQMRTFVMTAYDEENKNTVEAIGVDAFFAKPVGLDELKNKMVKVLTSDYQVVRQVEPDLEGTPAGKLLFVLEVLPDENDRLTEYLRECFSDRQRSGGAYVADFAYSIKETLDKLMSFKPDLVLINFDSLFQISCSQLASRIVQSPYRPKDVIIYGLNLEAEDKRMIQELGLQYVDQRRTFARLVTRVKQIALRNGLKQA